RRSSAWPPRPRPLPPDRYRLALVLTVGGMRRVSPGDDADAQDRGGWLPVHATRRQALRPCFGARRHADAGAPVAECDLPRRPGPAMSSGLPSHLTLGASATPPPPHRCGGPT